MQSYIQHAYKSVAAERKWLRVLEQVACSADLPLIEIWTQQMGRQRPLTVVGETQSGQKEMSN